MNESALQMSSWLQQHKERAIVKSVCVCVCVCVVCVCVCVCHRERQSERQIQDNLTVTLK